ncbi:MAG TPA: S8 family serine peptidase [Armatimonadota bacterium]|jgi:subtilisin family serine protease
MSVIGRGLRNCWGVGLLVVFCAAGWALPEATVPVPGAPYPQVIARGQVVMRAPRAVADRLIVGLQPGLSTASVSPLAVAGGGQVRRYLPRSRMLVVDLPPGSDLAAAAARYTRQPGVQFAVPDMLVYPQLVPNDPQYAQQWHLPLCHAPEGWDVTTGSSSVIIAVVDSGVDTQHPDLAGKIWTNPNPGSDPRYPNDIHGWNFIENNNNVRPVPVVGGNNDTVSHGTLAAGLAAAVSNEGWGAAGVSWQAQIMSLKVFAHDGVGTVSGVIEAIDYATAHGAKVINLSLGGSWSTAYTPSIQAAYNAGIVVVCAAGNGSMALGDAQSSWQSPVCNNGPAPLSDNMIIGVGATDRDDRKSYYTNWDTSSTKHFVDLCAPGDAIYGPLYYDAGFAGFTSYWGTNTGTSFSCPIVAGAAALVLALHPAYTPAQVLAALRGGADNIDALNPGYAGMLGGGRLNIARALGVVSPPQMVHNVVATDTLGDEGGSITVTWTKSGDDGAGASSVTKYQVLRRTGATGAFAMVKELPAGTELYVDASTTDGQDYYYKIRTWAGSQSSDSDVVGPAQSRDDLPPAAVTTLTAVDRPADSGGAIVLSWTYTPAADFQAYRVYRQNYKFTVVTGRTPVATLTDGALQTWTDTSVSDGVDYYYAITAVDQAGNENAAVTAVGPVQSYTNQPLQFPAGIQLLSSPVIPADQHPGTLLGLAPAQLRVARYNPASSAYVMYKSEPLPNFLKLRLGQGFWLNLGQPLTVSPTGQSAPAGDLAAPVVAGWQMLGNPFFGSVDFAACTATYLGNTMDLASAEAAGLLLSTAWVYDTATHGYVLVNDGAGGNSLIAPWQGIWVQGLKSCTLNLVRPSGAAVSAAVAAPRTAAAEGWRLRLTAQAGLYQDRDNFVGVAAAARQIESPPLPGVGVDLSLTARPEQAPVALALQTAGAASLTQPLTVSWAGVTGPVRVAWPDLTALPASKTALLTDLSSGQVVNLRNSPDYVFTATAASGQRQFSLTISDRGAGLLQVTALAAQPAGAGAQITFTLSAPATCDLTILNIAGRVIRQVASGALRPAGVSTLAWDGRNQGGARVPAGRYLVTLQARDEQGNATRVLRDLQLGG